MVFVGQKRISQGGISPVDPLARLILNRKKLLTFLLMARPQKKEIDKRTHRLPHVRCTENEGEIIRQKALASGMSVSDYIRHFALQGGVVSMNDNTNQGFDDNLVQQLYRIGNNLNQLTKKYHSTGVEPVTLRQLFPVLKNVLTRVFENLNVEN
ncbi:MAG: plasmid mobilization relaxosome protein MobC [Bacteroidetes bacterium]|nr:plasmid mobilization relaxosome protein MobC [Bacteroidota bacterium]